MPAWTYATLKVADTTLAIADIIQATAGLNAQTAVLTAQNVAWSAIRDVMMNNFDWGPLTQCATLPVGATLPGGGLQTSAIISAAIAIRESCIYGGMFGASVTANWNKLVAAANLLTPVAVGGITTTSANAVVALRSPTVPVWQPAVTSGDIQTARVQP